MRDALVEDIDEFLQAFSDDPEPEAVASYLTESLEEWADQQGIEEIITTLEEEGELDASLQETLETEMSSNDEFEFTGEEIVSLLERACGIEWTEDEDDDEDDDDDDEDDDDEDDDEWEDEDV
jgi:hypothetical protein